MKKDRAFFRKTDMILIAVLFILALAGFLLIKNAQGNTNRVYAQISRDGTVLETVELEKAEDGLLRVDGCPGIVFEIKDHRIRFRESDCPDKICIKSGFLSESGQSAVCMPNRTVLKIIGEDSDTDITVK